jgi:hypothetical protein
MAVNEIWRMRAFNHALPVKAKPASLDTQPKARLG